MTLVFSPATIRIRMSKRELQDSLKTITKRLTEDYKAEKVILFGSAARGDFGQNSDLDILVLKRGVDKLDSLQRGREARAMLGDIDIPVDILVHTPYEIEKRLYLRDPFFEKIFEEGKILYGRP